jgi:hypothetical protein
MWVKERQIWYSAIFINIYRESALEEAIGIILIPLAVS